MQLEEEEIDIPFRKDMREIACFNHEDKIIITTYSESHTKKDRKEREEKLKKAKEYLETPSKVERKAEGNYLKKTSKSSYILDEAKIARNERYDGFISISTNAKN